MREERTPWSHGVVLVCTNERDPAVTTKPSCGRARGLKLRSWLKQAARAEEGPVTECRVLATSCLDICPHDGVVVAIEPGGHTMVVDPETDRDALLAAVKREMENITANASGNSRRDRARRMFGRLKR